MRTALRAATKAALTTALFKLASSLLIGGAAAVDLIEVDGGPLYYKKFSYSLPTDPGYFPVGVWFESVIDSLADKDPEAGLNLYVVLTADSDLATVQRNGMRAIIQQSEFKNNPTAIAHPSVAGWELHDEIDMQAPVPEAYGQLSEVVGSLARDGRLRYNNYGKGVLFWLSDADAAHFVNGFQHITSADAYWFTDPFIRGGSEGGHLLNNDQPLTYNQTRRAANYGYTVDRLRALDAMDGVRQPIWSFVEVGWPFSETAEQGGRAIRPEEIKAAVWHSIIAGARGIIYFNHSFGGQNPTHHALRDPAYADIRSAVKQTNALIHRLAPVLNAPFAINYVKADESIRVMAKFHGGKYYIFAGSKENKVSISIFTLTGPETGSAIVIGEDRSIPIVRGKFSDFFRDGNAIHIYRIDP